MSPKLPSDSISMPTTFFMGCQRKPWLKGIGQKYNNRKHQMHSKGHLLGKCLILYRRPNTFIRFIFLRDTETEQFSKAATLTLHADMHM